MFDTAVWGSGDTEQGRFKANKAIASASIEEVPGGILVDWGGGDTVILPGTTSQVSILPAPQLTLTVSTSSARIIRNNVTTDYSWTRSFSALENICDLSDLGISLNLSGAYWANQTEYQTFGGNPSGNSTHYFAYWIFQSGNKKYALHFANQASAMSFAGITGTASLGGKSISRVRTSMVGGSSSGVCTNEQGNPPIYLVETNEGATAQKQSATPPTVTALVAGCKIVIIHEDNEIVEIPLNYCPEWVNLLDFQACPAGSCECIHDGHKCCYDNSTGALIKVIPL